VTLTTKDVQKKKNDVKARTTLLLSLSDEHQLRFNKHKTVKELWAAILKTFGGNEATKKTKKNLLKQQYGNFRAEGSETLGQTFTRLGISILLAVGTPSTGSGNLYYQWELSPGSGNALCILFPTDDMEEMDIKLSMALLSMRADKIWKRTRKKISIQGSDVAGFDKSKVECFNCHKMGHFARECRAPRSQERGRKDKYRQGSKTEEKIPKALMEIDGVGCDWSYMANAGDDHALVADAEAPTEFALMANTESKELETLKLEKDGLDGKLAGLLKASKNLDNLIESQRPSPTVASTSAEGQNKNSTTSEDVASPNTPKPFVKFVKPKDNQSECKTNKQEKPKKPQVKYAEQYRHSNKKPNVKGNQRNWNNLKSYQLGPEFVLKKKACFNCGDFTHLANKCRKRVQRKTTRSQNHAHMSPLHRSVGHRPHGAPMRSPHRSAGHRPHGASMRPSHRPTSHRPHGPSMNPMRPNMNGARPNKLFFIQAHSYETRPFLKSSAVKTQYKAPWVPTFNRNNPLINRKFSTGRRNFPTVNRKFPTASRKFTTGSTKIHTANMGRKGKVVKPSACWVWNPSQNLSNKGQFPEQH
nr:hypothetical protein [Tanacetum cinerariifolium]